jgi:hypothetical protein
MKQATSALASELYDLNVHQARDLYTLELAAGTQRWTSADVAVTVGSDTWTPAAVEGQIPQHAALGLEVDSIDVTFGSEIDVGGTRVVERALYGELHGVRLLVTRAWVKADGTIAGTETLFDGEVEEVDPSSDRVHVAAKSAVARMQSSSLAGWLVSPACPFQVYDAQCGVDPADFTHPRSVGSGSTTEEVVLGSASTFLTVGGWLHFTSGALAGQRATVMEVLTSTRARVASPLPSAPVAGADVNVVKGCPKTLAGCDEFSNRVVFGGAPWAPSEDAGRT